METRSQPLTPAGVPAGDEFAGHDRSEAAITLGKISLALEADDAPAVLAHLERLTDHAREVAVAADLHEAYPQAVRAPFAYDEVCGSSPTPPRCATPPRPPRPIPLTATPNYGRSSPPN